MTDEALIEELAWELRRAMNWFIEADVWAADITDEERRDVIKNAILPIIQRERLSAGEAVKEAAKSQFSMDPEALDEPDYADFVYDCIRALNVEAIVGGGE